MATKPSRQTMGDRCAEWLIGLLRDGSEMRPQVIVDLGEQVGYSRAMIYRARERMPEILDTSGRKHPENCWKLDPLYEPPTARSAEDQIAALNDWLAEHDPDLYWGTPELDTAAAVLQALEHRPSRGRLLEMLGTELGLQVEVL